MTFASYKDAVTSYTHLYRNGIIEMVEAEMLSYRLSEDDPRRYIPGVGFERLIIEGTRRGLSLLRQLGSSVPVAVAVSLCEVKNMVMGTDNWRWRRQLHPVLNEHLFLPEVLFTDVGGSVENSVRPVIDRVWNACGVSRSPHFSEDGVWTPPR